MFALAIAVFTISSVFCGLAMNVPQMVAARILQGIGAAMMMPVGRLTVIRTFSKGGTAASNEFRHHPRADRAVAWPDGRRLDRPLVVVAGDFLLVNIPAGIVALWLIHRYMPDYYGDASRPLDVIGLVLFGAGTAVLSWLLEIFGEHEIDISVEAALLLLALSLLAAYWRHARQTPYPLLQLALFKVRTFRVSVIGGFITRLGVGGLPFLTPLLFQIGLGLPAWQSGMPTMPTAAAAMGMKFISTRVLGLFGYRKVLIVNTVLIGLTICLYALVTAHTSLAAIIAIGLALGFFNSLQFSSMNSMAYADIETSEFSMASTIASSFQQISMSFGLACGSGGSMVSWRSAAVRSPRGHHGATSRFRDLGRVDHRLLTVLLDATRQGWRERQPCDTGSGMTPPAPVGLPLATRSPSFPLRSAVLVWHPPSNLRTPNLARFMPQCAQTFSPLRPARRRRSRLR